MKRVVFSSMIYSAAIALMFAQVAAQGAAAVEQTPLSPEAVQAEVDALRKQDVAWRKIAWKTCLLDGLHASREQHKPIVLWIFIDRPIDDERC